MQHSEHAERMAIEPLYLILLGAGWLLYVGAIFLSNKKRRPWPWFRTVFWSAGIISMALVLTGPLAAWSHTSFIAHMVGHLLLGMLAPLFMVLSAPMTLILRALNVDSARRLVFLLKSRPIFWLSHPVTAAILNVGGLYVLYTTDIYLAMHHNPLIELVVHAHVFFAGYLFTGAIIYIDPVAHRFSYLYRSVILIAALAGHGILSKYIYAYPPTGVPRGEAEAGGMLMYYGGDAIDLMLIVILCYHWYKATRPRLPEIGSEGAN
ncbi:cytochrome c oxidase assembly protein [Planomicrobium sp. CPCC 101079]|uniref:cytochrome c oxidase assembly protein n=1 Tax=Planomicrobium sp. CPCC 101079 TaxID=2599618 RepID=UPI0011B49A32|nr:cytochrome c oxidase assembly protein [Planomicrobium sp. CPCC 101079]TWT16027.1 cytochrome c oxidase assembly protein [Planomicrobium sp. CPCC 101079]